MHRTLTPSVNRLKHVLKHRFFQHKNCHFHLSPRDEIQSKPVEKFGEYACSISQLMTEERANGGGGEKARQRHTEKNGKLLVRERIANLLDKNTFFLELSEHAGYKLYKGETVSAGGVITGVGSIDGVRCMVIANDATVKGGTIYPIGLQKQLRAQQVALENHLPCVYLVDSGGAFLPMQDEIFNPGGQIFYNEAIMNSMEIPSLAVICGSCTAGAAYVPAMADEAIIVDKVGTVFLAGPPLVFAATGEKVSAEQLGGAFVHTQQSGLCDEFARDEVEALSMARDAVSLMNYPDRINPIWHRTPHFDEPVFSANELGALCTPVLGDNKDKGTGLTGTMEDILARLVDGSRFRKFKPKYGGSLLCGWARLQGHPIAIVANADRLVCSNGARKAAQFVQMATKRRVPIMFVHNTTGISDGDQGPGSGAKESAMLIHALSCSKMPKISLIVGDSIGPSNFAMCGRGMNPSFLFSWPNSRIAIDTSKSEAIGREGIPNSMFATARLWDDGVLMYEDTRNVLGSALEACRFRIKSENRSKYGVVRL